MRRPASPGRGMAAERPGMHSDAERRDEGRPASPTSLPEIGSILPFVPPSCPPCLRGESSVPISPLHKKTNDKSATTDETPPFTPPLTTRADRIRFHLALIGRPATARELAESLGLRLREITGPLCKMACRRSVSRAGLSPDGLLLWYLPPDDPDDDPPEPARRAIASRIALVRAAKSAKLARQGIPFLDEAELDAVLPP